jgi:hypothetical protein
MDYKTYYLNQAGGNYEYFRGAARQRGYGIGGMFKSMFKYLFPLIRSHALPVIKKGAEMVGSEALKAASNFTTDAIRGRNLKDSFQEHSTSAIDNLSNQMQAKIQAGSGRKRKNYNQKGDVKRKKSTFKKNPNQKQVRFKKQKFRRLSDIFD